MSNVLAPHERTRLSMFKLRRSLHQTGDAFEQAAEAISAVVLVIEQGQAVRAADHLVRVESGFARHIGAVQLRKQITRRCEGMRRRQQRKQNRRRN